MVTPTRHTLLSEAIARHGDELRAFVAARVPGSEVDDIVQSAFERAAKRLDTLRDSTAIRAWLYRIVRNTIVDHRRRAAPPTDDLRSVDPARLQSEFTLEAEGTQCCCALSLISSLPAGQAEVLEAVVLREDTPAEAAARMGISRGNADVRLHRARKTLRDRLEDHCGVTSMSEAHDCTCSCTV